MIKQAGGVLTRRHTLWSATALLASKLIILESDGRLKKANEINHRHIFDVSGVLGADQRLCRSESHWGISGAVGAIKSANHLLQIKI